MLKHPASDQWEAEKAMEVQDVEGLRGLREQAGRLLARLEKGREMSERRAAETGQRDPMRFITGRSALDSAITATRGMIARMDALLAEFTAEFEAMDGVCDIAAMTARNGGNGRVNGSLSRAPVACAGSAI